MRPPAFAYARPDTIQGAVEILAEHGEEAKVLAGGQSLIPLMKLRVVYPGLIVDVNRVQDLGGLELDDQWLTVGALTRHVDVQRHAAARAALPIVADVVDHLADVQVRNLGTPVGSAAEADPSGDWAPVMLALNSQVVCRSSNGYRTVSMEDFFVDYLTSDLKPTELIEAIRMRRPSQPGSGSAFLKLERRVGDFAVVSAAVALTIDSDGRCTEIGIGLGGVGLTPFKAKAAEDLLRGAILDQPVIAEAAELVRTSIAPIDDTRGPTWYKRDMAAIYFQRALASARQRAQASLVAKGQRP